jgi:cytochrome c oxidase cbb3-type subunit III
MRHHFVWLPASLAVLLAGCGHPPETYTLPDQVTDFTVLYKNNCAGCHGQDGRLGAARPLNDSLYLAVISKEQNRMRDVIAKGVHGTAMPAFAENAGGTLTDRQIAILAGQIDARWSRPRDYIGVTLPPYSAELGDASRGERVFVNYCSRCHGKEGMGATNGGRSGGSVVDPALLALVSNQSIRTTVIAGRANVGCPNWKGDSPDHVMTPQEISDVVAWVAAHRTPATISARQGTSTP